MNSLMKGMIMKGMMKVVIKAAALAASLCVSVAGMAQVDVAGVWAGKLEVAPGNSIGVHFTLAQDAAGAWTATLNSPDTGAIKDVPASSVSFDGTTLNIDVASLSGSYNGVLNNGTFTGEWTQPGGKLPMNLAPFVPTVLSEEAITLLLGQWHGKMMTPGMQMNIVFTFERNDAGEFTGVMQQIDMSETKVPLGDISFENNELFFRVPQARAEYRGTFVDGGFNGSVKQGPQDMALNIVKGEYVAEKITLALTDADYDKLAGEWTGTLTPPGAPNSLTLIMSIKRDDSGAIAATIKSPQQGNVELKVSSASLSGSTFAAAMTAPPASFTGELDGTTITGTWTQGPGALPL
ncbi:MAG: hypothetical protein SV422_09845, partial [Pseudomonadota bacterium]|nr:hypothetical protein [Pseudomonadota bacterium]